MQNDSLFRSIFSDAQVVDIDLAAWDKRIALYVLADHAGRTADNRLPMFVVEFHSVRQWALNFNHLDREPSIVLGLDEHVQWLIHDFHVSTVAGDSEIRLWGHSTSPQLTLTCREVAIHECPLQLADRLYPGWAKPRMGFIRPSLEGQAYARSQDAGGARRGGR